MNDHVDLTYVWGVCCVQLSFIPMLMKSHSVRTRLTDRVSDFGKISKETLDFKKDKIEQLLTELSPRRKPSRKDEMSDLKRN